MKFFQPSNQLSTYPAWQRKHKGHSELVEAYNTITEQTDAETVQLFMTELHLYNISALEHQLSILDELGINAEEYTKESFAGHLQQLENRLNEDFKCEANNISENQRNINLCVETTIVDLRAKLDETFQNRFENLFCRQ